MKFECDCDFRTKAVGDCCIISNTQHAISMLPTPKDLEEELKIGGGFSDDQALYIASEVYQPLVILAKFIDLKLMQLAEKV